MLQPLPPTQSSSSLLQVLAETHPRPCNLLLYASQICLLSGTTVIAVGTVLRHCLTHVVARIK